MKKIARSLLLMITLFIVGDVVSPMLANAQPGRGRRRHHPRRHHRPYRGHRR